MQIFALKSCDTCRRVIRELRAAGHDPQVVDVRSDGVEAVDLDRFLAAFGDELVNRRSTTWRGLSEAERGEKPDVLLLRHPTLMKRPVIDADGKLSLGWGEDVRAIHLG